jgi:hypothetical protein
VCGISRLTKLLIVLCACSPILFQQDQSPNTDPERDKDAQAIYSWVISHSTGEEKLYLIAPKTSQSDYPQERCLAIPPEHAADFREIRADFERRKNITREIPRSLSTSKPYVILALNVAEEIMLKSPALSQSPIVRDRYAGAEHLLLFSDVYFNRKRTAALVHVDRWCGGVCGISIWMALEKGNDGMWQYRTWAQACPVIA